MVLGTASQLHSACASGFAFFIYLYLSLFIFIYLYLHSSLFGIDFHQIVALFGMDFDEKGHPPGTQHPVLGPSGGQTDYCNCCNAFFLALDHRCW